MRKVRRSSLFLSLSLFGSVISTALAEPSFLQQAGTTQKPAVAPPRAIPGTVGGGRVRPDTQPSQPGDPNVTVLEDLSKPKTQQGQAPGRPQSSMSSGVPTVGGTASRMFGADRPAPGKGVALTFTNAPVEQVVASVMKELGYSYVIDPQVTGTVNLYTQGEIPRDQLFPIMEQLLQLNGHGIVKQGDLYVVVPLGQTPKIPSGIMVRPEAKAPEPPPAEPTPTAEPPDPNVAETGSPVAQTEPPQQPDPAAPQQPSRQTPGEPQEPAQQPPAAQPTGEPSQAAQEEAQQTTIRQLEQAEGVVTYIIPLHYVPSSEMVTMLKAFVSEGATVIDFVSSNLVILIDYRQNVRQALEIVRLLDTEYFSINTVDLISVRFNQAKDVAEDLGKIFAPGDKAGGVRIVAIERLNSILVVTHSPQVLKEVRGWIDRLDAPSTSSNVRTYVYEVQNSTAATIAEILGQLYQDGSGLPSGGEASPGQQQQQQQQESQAQRRQQGPAGFLPERSQTGLGPSLAGRSLQSGIQAAVVTGNVKIIVNDFNNSLIIQGTQADYQFLEQTIRLLDVLPRQVLIEAKVYAVELRDDLSFGVSAFLQALNPGEGGVFGPATSGSIAAPGEGSSGGALSVATRIFVGNSRQLDLFVNALRTKTDVEVLEAPELMVLDGTQAQINVGAEVPVTTASFGDPLVSGSNTAFVNSIQFRPTGTTLLLLPRISASGIVTMDLAIEVSNATGEALTPTINRNFVQTSMIARDGQTIAIAGVISDSYNLAKNRVPLLGDIPVLGALFGQTSRTKRRYELIFLVTPRVIRDLPTAVELTLDFRRALRGAYDFIERKEQEDQRLRQDRRQKEMDATQPSEPPQPPPFWKE